MPFFDWYTVCNYLDKFRANVMTLLPIIYTSLLIFTALFVFVVLVSYISYKTRTRNNLPPHHKHLDIRGDMVAVRPGAYSRNYNSKQLSNTVPRIISEHKTKISTTRMNNIDMGKLSSNYNLAIDFMRHKEDSANEMERARSKKKSRRLDYRTTSINDRLVIMNNTEKFRTPSQNEVYEEKPGRHYTNHSELNVLTYYSDRPEMDFAALAAPRVNRAM